LILQNTVLKRDDRRVGTHHRSDLLERSFGVPQFHAEHYEIDCADLRRIVSRVDASDVDVFGTFDPQASASHRLKVFAAGNEVHVRAPLAKTSTEVAAKSARAHERDTHGLRLP
jgi:hypothetical protein